MTKNTTAKDRNKKAEIIKTPIINDNVDIRRTRKQHYDKQALSKTGSYAEPNTRVSIRSRKQK